MTAVNNDKMTVNAVTSPPDDLKADQTELGSDKNSVTRSWKGRGRVKPADVEERELSSQVNDSSHEMKGVSTSSVSKVSVDSVFVGKTPFRAELEKLLHGQLEHQPGISHLTSLVKMSSPEDVEASVFSIDDEYFESDDLHSVGAAHDIESKDQCSQYHRALDGFKEALGGAPNYLSGKPVLELKKKFLGIPINTVKMWVSKGLEKKWFPKVLWRSLGNKLNLSKTGLTHYEYLSLSMQSINKLKQYLPKIKSMILNNKANVGTFSRKVTGLKLHDALHDPKVLASSLEDYVFLFEKNIERAIKENKVLEFFEEAMPKGDVCFEARMSSMMRFSAAHPLHDSDAISLDAVADYDSSSSVEHVLNEELKKLLLGGEGDLEEVSSGEIYKYLVDKCGLLGRTFSGGYSESFGLSDFLGKEPGPQSIVIDESLLKAYLDYAENILCLFCGDSDDTQQFPMNL